MNSKLNIGAQATWIIKYFAGLGAGLGFLASSFGFSQSIAGIASPDTNVDVRVF